MPSKRASDLVPGDVVVGRRGWPFVAGPAKVAYVSPANRGGQQVGYRIHWAVKPGQPRRESMADLVVGLDAEVDVGQ